MRSQNLAEEAINNGFWAREITPVTTPDATSMYAGNARDVDVLANDTDADPDGAEDLAVCRMGDETYRRVFAESVGDGVVFVYSLPSAKPGTYTFTYYACDFQTLVPGTLTVTIDAEPDVTAKALPGQPGKIKVTNPADFKIYKPESFRVLSPEAAYMTARMLESVITQGTAIATVGKWAEEQKDKGRKLPELAAKTGTTNDCVDAWMVGITPDLALGVFIGCDKPRSLGPLRAHASDA